MGPPGKPQGNVLTQPLYKCPELMSLACWTWHKKNRSFPDSRLFSLCSAVFTMRLFGSHNGRVRHSPCGVDEESKPAERYSLRLWIPNSMQQANQLPSQPPRARQPGFKVNHCPRGCKLDGSRWQARREVGTDCLCPHAHTAHGHTHLGRDDPLCSDAAGVAMPEAVPWQLSFHP